MTAEAPRVSVIMPVFNTAAYPLEVISSVLLLIFEGVGLLRQIGRMFSVPRMPPLAKKS